MFLLDIIMVENILSFSDETETSGAPPTTALIAVKSNIKDTTGRR